MIYLGWLGVIVWRSCVGESGAQLRCLPLPLPGLMLTVWLNGGNETATMAITAAHHTQDLTSQGITRG